ncbi:MAG: hypothetical protein AAGI11_06960 [Pseudomonadota bacterium]
MKTPAVLFMIFNRPELTARSFAAIRRARPARLYIAADGPRKAGVNDDEARCAQARAYTDAVDWPCEVQRLYQTTNRGGRYGPEAAIDWFFEHETEGIILEDDCLAGDDFFPYCAALLDQHRDNEAVMLISGDRSFGYAYDTGPSYSYSRYPLIWGWASWRRAWQHNDRARFAAADWTRELEAAGLPAEFARRRGVHCRDVAAGRLQTWDFVWSYAVFCARGLACIPALNLVTNIGFGGEGTRLRDPSLPRANVPSQVMNFPLVHPHRLAADARTDRLISLYVHGVKPQRPREIS